MTRNFQPFERHRNPDGTVYTDPEGCIYFKPHTNPLLAGKEFANPMGMLQTIDDHNNQNPSAKFSGEVVLLEIITY